MHRCDFGPNSCMLCFRALERPSLKSMLFSYSKILRRRWRNIPLVPKMPRKIPSEMSDFWVFDPKFLNALKTSKHCWDFPSRAVYLPLHVLLTWTTTLWYPSVLLWTDVAIYDSPVSICGVTSTDFFNWTWTAPAENITRPVAGIWSNWPFLIDALFIIAAATEGISTRIKHPKPENEGVSHLTWSPDQFSSYLGSSNTTLHKPHL